MANNVTQGNANQPRNLAQLISALGQQSSVVQTSKVDPKSLAAGIQSSYSVLTFGGKTWNIRYRGNDNPLLVRDRQTNAILGPVPTVDVIIVRSATPISKTFYLKPYEQGSFAKPDCWSTNGVAPDPGVPPSTKQHDNCPGCKWDAFGSAARQVGDRVINAKRCTDNKRVAVVPAGDLKNEAYGGPMLLRLPPTTFQGLAEVQDQLLQQGYHYFGVVMRCSFDHEVTHPKIIFTPVRVLNDHEATEIVALQDSPIVNRILSEEVVEVKADPQQAAPPEASAPITPPTPPTMPYHKVDPNTGTPQQTAFSPVAPPAQQELPPVEMTAEQRRIAELEAKLAAMEGETKPRRARRTAPVTPLGQQPAVQAQPAPQQGSVAQNDADEGDAPADLDSRIDALLKPNGGTP
jgi:hypothetical protein